MATLDLLPETVTGRETRTRAELALSRLRTGCVIPAHPLALDAEGRFDERRQRALARYYLAAGAGGLAVAVHSTEFAIHDPRIGLLEPVLSLAAEVVRADPEPVILIAGACGPTADAVREAEVARSLGYHATLLSPGGLGDASERQLIDRTRAVADVLPVIGFYLQQTVGGRPLSFDYWRSVAAIPGVVAIKIAAFDRYATVDVARAVCESGRADEVVLYTGNDDNIVVDLLSEFDLQGGQGPHAAPVGIRGGLLGHWGIWTRAAVGLYAEVQEALAGNPHLLPPLLRKANRVTDSNKAVFDAANGFRGAVPGIKEVLRQQGLLLSSRCLNPSETLSPGQREEIDRVRNAYPELTDDEFVAEHLESWMA